MPRTSRSATTTTDHDEIRRWAEERGGSPAAVKRRTRGDAGILRIDFPGFSGNNLKHISWDEWFDTFDHSELALLHRERDRFNKIVRREADGHKTTRGRTTTRRAHARPKQRASSHGSHKSSSRR